jgi:glyoxylase-like metal-dependent hydrolase (beta-lactamase superfamily II)
MTAGENAALVNDQDYVKDADKQFLNLDYGDCFDLGGITLEILDGTEHSQGSVCILIKEERAILLGDFCNQFTFMFLEESSTIEDYVEILLNVKKREGDFDKVYVSHGQGDAPKSVLDEVIIETCRDILEGKSEDVEYQFMDFTAYIAHNIAGIGEREDGKFGNVVYHKEKVYKNTQNVTSVQFFLKEK